MLLNILPCTQQLPPTKNHPAQNVDSTGVEKPWVRGICMHPDSEKVPRSQPGLGLRKLVIGIGSMLSGIPEREYVALKYFDASC